MATSYKTHDREKIKQWTKERNGVPAKVAGTDKKGGGILRIHFPQAGNDEQFNEISWNEFFDELEKNKLDVVIQEEKENGELSSFHKFVNRE